MCHDYRTSSLDTYLNNMALHKTMAIDSDEPVFMVSYDCGNDRITYYILNDPGDVNVERRWYNGAKR